MATTQRSNKDVVERTFAALNEQDREVFAELHTEDAVVHVGGREVRGIDAIVETEFAFFDAFPDLALTIDSMLEEGNVVAARWTITGTHLGEYEGIEPSGKGFEFTSMGMFRIEDGKTAEVWLEADNLGHLRQLGAVGLPG